MTELEAAIVDMKFRCGHREPAYFIYPQAARHWVKWARTELCSKCHEKTQAVGAQAKDLMPKEFERWEYRLDETANMGYCRFQNTLSDLRDCYVNMEGIPESETEVKAWRCLIKLCHQIAEKYEEEE